MRRLLPLILLGTILVNSCKKEEPLLKATLHAKCKDCIVSYAAGVSQSKHDTLLGIVDPGSGGIIADEHRWTIQLKDGDNIFLRACHLDSAVTDGVMQIWVDGEVRPDQANGVAGQLCVEINHTVHGQ